MCDAPDIYSASWHTARHSRACSECADVIAAGQRYEAVRQLTDGSWSSWSFCEHCSEWWDEFWRWSRRAGLDLCPLVGYLDEALKEAQEEIGATRDTRPPPLRFFEETR